MTALPSPWAGPTRKMPESLNRLEGIRFTSGTAGSPPRVETTGWALKRVLRSWRDPTPLRRPRGHSRCGSREMSPQALRLPGFGSRPTSANQRLLPDPGKLSESGPERPEPDNSQARRASGNQRRWGHPDGATCVHAQKVETQPDLPRCRRWRGWGTTWPVGSTSASPVSGRALGRVLGAWPAEGALGTRVPGGPWGAEPPRSG